MNCALQLNLPHLIPSLYLAIATGLSLRGGVDTKGKIASSGNGRLFNWFVLALVPTIKTTNKIYLEVLVKMAELDDYTNELIYRNKELQTKQSGQHNSSRGGGCLMMLFSVNVKK